MIYEERALALGGLLQACYLVNQLARTGLVGQDSLSGSLETIFVTNPDQTLDVYQGGNGVRTGLRLIYEILGDVQVAEHGDTIRYTMAILALEKKLRQLPDILRSIGAGISVIHENRCLNELPAAADEVVERLSRLYEETAGTIEPRIRVLGTQKHLNNPINTQRIRSLLMAALRSAVLWRQLDGRLTQCLLGRTKLLKATEAMSEIMN
jgi:high frequency lysogenization protein